MGQSRHLFSGFLTYGRSAHLRKRRVRRGAATPGHVDVAGPGCRRGIIRGICGRFPGRAKRLSGSGDQCALPFCGDAGWDRYFASAELGKGPGPPRWTAMEHPPRLPACSPLAFRGVTGLLPAAVGRQGVFCRGNFGLRIIHFACGKLDQGGVSPSYSPAPQCCFIVCARGAAVGYFSIFLGSPSGLTVFA